MEVHYKVVNKEEACELLKGIFQKIEEPLLKFLNNIPGKFGISSITFRYEVSDGEDDGLLIKLTMYVYKGDDCTKIIKECDISGEALCVNVLSPAVCLITFDVISFFMKDFNMPYNRFFTWVFSIIKKFLNRVIKKRLKLCIKDEFKRS